MAYRTYWNGVFVVFSYCLSVLKLQWSCYVWFQGSFGTLPMGIPVSHGKAIGSSMWACTLLQPCAWHWETWKLQLASACWVRRWLFCSDGVSPEWKSHDMAIVVVICPSIQWKFQDPKMSVLQHTRHYKTIFLGVILLHRPYIGLWNGRYLQFRLLEWPLKYGNVTMQTHGNSVRVRLEDGHLL